MIVTVFCQIPLCTHHARKQTCADPEWVQGVRTPPWKIKKLQDSLTIPDPIENHKATKPAFNVGPSWAHKRQPCKWRYAGGPMIARF